MPRKILDQELQELIAQIIHLGHLVDNTLAKTLKSLETGDHAGLSLLVDSSSGIENLCSSVEKQSLRLLILQQPLGGRDLRFLTASLPIIGQLQQADEEAIDIARTIQQIRPLSGFTVSSLDRDDRSLEGIGDHLLEEEPVQITEQVILRGLFDLGAEARHMLQATMEAFANYDIDAAREMEENSKFIEIRYQRVCHDLMTMLARTYTTISALQSGLYLLENATYLFWIAQRLKQFAEHATKICTRIIFIVKGEMSIN